MKTIHRDYAKKSTAQAALFIAGMAATTANGATFDSASFAADGVKGSNDAPMPEQLRAVVDEAGDHGKTIVQAIYDGVRIYEQNHGVSAPADVVEQAIHSAYSVSSEGRKIVLDSASSAHSDNLSLQPNRAVVAILSTFNEAIPFAHYLPADIGSNEAKLGILSHIAGVAHGGYASGANMDGVNAGEAFLSASRVHKCAIDGAGAMTGKLTKIQTTFETCDPAGGNLKTQRGRAIVYVNGKVAAREVSASGTGASAVSGSITISGTTYAIAGSINTDTGEIALTSAPAIPGATAVHVEGFIDYEREKVLVPNIATQVDMFTMYAKSWRAYTTITMDSRTQISNELGLDAYGEGVLAINSQFASERHYEALRKCVRLGIMNQEDFDFDWDTRSPEMNRSQIWLDFLAVVGKASQKMANANFSHGITHLYVGDNCSAQFAGLPREVWQPSGIPVRAGIYRMGRLAGMYDVYYTPKGLSQSADGKSSQILAVGRANDVTRNPIVLGDAVAPVVQQMGVNAAMEGGTCFYARNFTEVNPHGPSSESCALINVTNLV